MRRREPPLGAGIRLDRNGRCPLNASLEESWELGTNGGQGTALASVTTAYQYIASATPPRCRSAPGMAIAKVTTNTYQNDAPNWLLGRLIRSEVTSTTRPTERLAEYRVVLLILGLQPSLISGYPYR